MIVRRLQGAETLGSVYVVLSDKTGTMTEKKLRLSAVLLADGSLNAVNVQQLDAQPLDRQNCLREYFNAAVLAILGNTNDPTDLAIV